MLKTENLIRVIDKLPNRNSTVLFVWWHRNGIETSQMSCGYVDAEDNIHTDLKFNGNNSTPDFWHPLFQN